MNIEDRVLNLLSEVFTKFEEIESAKLFGSRARGDNTERSDYDIAVYGELSRRTKNELSLYCEYDIPTLFKIDLIFMCSQNNKAFIENIEKDGIIFYVRREK